jgi:hypothetical protein
VPAPVAVGRNFDFENGFSETGFLWMLDFLMLLSGRCFVLSFGLCSHCVRMLFAAVRGDASRSALVRSERAPEAQRDASTWSKGMPKSVERGFLDSFL